MRYPIGSGNAQRETHMVESSTSAPVTLAKAISPDWAPSYESQ